LILPGFATCCINVDGEVVERGRADNEAVKPDCGSDGVDTDDDEVGSDDVNEDAGFVGREGVSFEVMDTTGSDVARGMAVVLVVVVVVVEVGVLVLLVLTGGGGAGDFGGGRARKAGSIRTAYRSSVALGVEVEDEVDMEVEVEVEVEAGSKMGLAEQGGVTASCGGEAVDGDGSSCGIDVMADMLENSVKQAAYCLSFSSISLGVDLVRAWWCVNDDRGEVAGGEASERCGSDSVIDEWLMDDDDDDDDDDDGTTSTTPSLFR
jgi:hypothetical protein